MTITVQVPSILRSRCDGLSELTLSAPDVRAALEHIERRYPSLHQSICDETGAVRRHINLFVNTSLVRRDGKGLDTELSTGDVVSIFQSVSGG